MSSQPDVSKICDFDHHDAAPIEERVAIYSDLRQRCPIARSDHHGGFYVLTRRKDIETVLRDDQTFTADKAVGGKFIPPIENGPVFFGELSAPVHRACRAVVNPLLSRRAVEGLRPMIEREVNAAIDEVQGKQSIDLVLDLTDAIPARVTLGFFGLDASGWRDVVGPLHRIAYTVPGSDERRQATVEVLALEEKVWAAADERRCQRTNDGLSTLVVGVDEDSRINEDDFRAVLNGLLIGGVDTTGALLAFALLSMQRDPRQREALADDDALALAIEEWLRFSSPGQTVVRNVTRRVTVGDVSFEPGDRLLLALGSANRDESVYVSPDEILVQREPNRHLAFGIGEHLCVGANLARVEAQIALRAICERLPHLRIREDEIVPFPVVGFISGWISMPADLE
jgi:cytochrome P450